jgi:uncharacterized protein (TIGR04255 family)
MSEEERHYARPPITEAVLELRFEGLMDSRDLERTRDRFKSKYSNVEQVREFQVSVLPDGKLAQKITSSGFKMTDKNAVDVLRLAPSVLGTIRLAPYERWEKLLSQAKENFETLTKLLGRKKVIRIGTRFINRIDIPNSLLEGRKLSDFFRIGAIAIPEVRSVSAVSLAVNAVHAGTGAKLIVQSGTVEPALIDHTSVSLDTDAYWDADIPLRVDEMWEKTRILREAKNSIFERSITDHMRSLFQ